MNKSYSVIVQCTKEPMPLSTVVHLIAACAPSRFLGNLLTSMMGLEAKTLSSMLASLAEPLTVAKYLMAYLADTVFPAPDSPLTMMDWFLSSLRRQKTNNIRGQNTRNTVVGGAFAKLKVSVTSATGRLMTKMNCDRIVDSTVDS